MTASHRIRAGAALVAVLAFALLPIASRSRAAVVVGGVDLAASLVPAPAAVDVGQSVTLTATVTDNGPNEATGVSLSVALSGARGSISAVATGVPGSTCIVARSRLSARCTLGSLAVGATDRMAVTVTPAAPGILVATATPRATGYDPLASNGKVQTSVRVAEHQSPVVSQVYGGAFEQPFTVHRRFTVRWHAADSGSGVASYDLRYRAAPVDSGFGPYKVWLHRTKIQSSSFGGVPGTTYCFSVRATDFDRNTSGWTPDKCAAVLLPATMLRRTGSWRASGAEGGLRTRGTGATLTLASVVARHFVLDALVGPGYGSVRVAWKGRVLATLNLAAATRSRQTFTVGAFNSNERGALTVTVLSSGKTVALDALGVAKG